MSRTEIAIERLRRSAEHICLAIHRKDELINKQAAVIRLYEERMAHIPHTCITHKHLTCGGCITAGALDKAKELMK